MCFLSKHFGASTPVHRSGSLRELALIKKHKRCGVISRSLQSLRLASITGSVVSHSSECTSRGPKGHRLPIKPKPVLQRCASLLWLRGLFEHLDLSRQCDPQHCRYVTLDRVSLSGKICWFNTFTITDATDCTGPTKKTCEPHTQLLAHFARNA